MSVNSGSSIGGTNSPVTVMGANPPPVHARQSARTSTYRRSFADQSAALMLQALQANAGNASAYNDLGNLLVQSGDLANAAAAFQSALTLAGNDANVWNNLGSVLHRQKQLAAAENAYRSALSHDADFVPALRNLAALLAETAREEESSLLACRAFVLPPLAGKSPEMLAIANYRLGRIDDAAECYRQWLAAEPDNAMAQYRLTACTGKNVPARTPDGFVRTLFDEMAANFEEKLVGKLAYRGPQIIAALLAGHVSATGSLDVLDGGCGTGLCAPLLAPYARHLTGVDISPKMLEKAQQRALYGELAEGELTAYLHGKTAAFDLIVMTDTLVYFGDLSALFAAVRQALRPAGIFVFTVETAVEPAMATVDYQLKPSGRYGHSRRYLARQLNAAGFAPKLSEDVVLRSELCRPTQGIGVLAGAISH